MVRNLVTGGFGKAMSLVFMAELFDKTFFVAMLLAMRTSKLFAFNASIIALGVMSFISGGIGAVVGKLPFITRTFFGLSIQEIITSGFLTYFGLKILKESNTVSAKDEEEEAMECVDGLNKCSVDFDEEEVPKKRNIIKRLKDKSLFFKSILMVFAAEWGDRSMLATIALGANLNPLSVALGATGGHALATMIAVQGGGILSNHLDEKKVSRFSGSLFLFFAFTTLFKLY